MHFHVSCTHVASCRAMLHTKITTRAQLGGKGQRKDLKSAARTTKITLDSTRTGTAFPGFDQSQAYDMGSLAKQKVCAGLELFLYSYSYGVYSYGEGVGRL